MMHENGTKFPVCAWEDHDARHENRTDGDIARRHASKDLAAMRTRLDAWFDRLERSTRLLTVVGGVCLLGIVVVLSLGVLMRYAFGAPLLGVNEIIQLAAVALVMSALPYCTATEQHVAVDVFENALGGWGRFIGDVFSRILSGLLMAILCRRAVLSGLDAKEFEDATNMLRLPIWPLYAILAAGAGLCAVIFALQLLLVLQRGPRS